MSIVSTGVRVRLPAIVALAAALLALTASPAFAGAFWRLDSTAAPTYLSAGKEARVIASANNVGDSTLRGSGAHPVTVTDRLPAGLQVPASVTAAAIEGKLEANDRSEAASRLECAIEEPKRKEVSCKTTASTQPLAPYTQLRVVIPVEVLSGAATGEQNTVSVAGGETEGGTEFPPAGPFQRPITVSGEATPFGIERYELSPEEEDGTFDVRAGSHPFQLTTTLDLNEALAPGGEGQAELVPSAPALARNLGFQLPPGLLGDPLAVPRCSDVDFSTIGANNVNACPAATAIGVAMVTLNLPSPPLGVFTEAVPVFNLTPAPGEPARFGLEDTKVPIILDTAVRTSGDYGVSVTVKNTTQAAQLLTSQVVLWGEPSGASHDRSRGWACLRAVEVNGETCAPPVARSSTPFLTLPTSCTGQLATAMSGEAWTGAAATSEYLLQAAPGKPLAALEGCEQIPFTPSISVVPVDEHEGETPGAVNTTASTPTGLNVDVKLPSEQGALGEGAIRDTTVTLPRGVQLNPSAANGLAACSEAEIGYEGKPAAPDPLSPGAPEPLRFSSAPAQCPPASKVGTVRIKSPDLEHELQGGVYVAEQEHNPFASLFAIYLTAEDAASGVRVKLAGQVTLDEETGQVTTIFTDTPQVPLEDLKLHFFEGPRASLSTPPLCGNYSTTAGFTPWSSPTATTSQSSFPITTGPGGCASPEPFQPALSAGAGDEQAGAFTSFSLTINRPDGDQALRGLAVHLPPGIAAVLASVTPCPEPQAAADQCGPESLIGHSTAISGLGPDAVALPGTVYLTGPYEGAPFGIEVSTPAIAGPFNLGTEVVRSTINIDPSTAAVTITSDPIPTRLKGVPAQIKQLNVAVDRPGFQFNPTSCVPMSVIATVTGDQGAQAGASSPFQVGGCGGLPFAPKLTASVDGHASRLNGTTFRVKVDSAGLGQANIKKVNLQLPVELPSRLTTLQKACLVATFEANPAGCSEESIIGTAIIHTPVLKNPLTGPAYLVSHGGAAFPDVEFVLQGEGITLVLDGKTDIKNGITYSRFETAPDAPFTTFETVLPAGPHSALTVYTPKTPYELCGTSLSMPTEITGQNGALISQSTPITPTGCGAVRRATVRKPTRAQLLAKALRACRSKYKHNRRKRTLCERTARRHYAAHKTSHKAKPKPATHKRH